jgi:hypothetical protein
MCYFDSMLRREEREESLRREGEALGNEEEKGIREICQVSDILFDYWADLWERRRPLCGCWKLLGYMRHVLSTYLVRTI